MMTVMEWVLFDLMTLAVLWDVYQQLIQVGEGRMRR